MAENPEILIEVVSETDQVCAPCPHQRGKFCESEEKITALDRAHAALLNINAGDVFSWRTALSKIIQHVSLEKFHQACASCRWKTLGICENKVRGLKEKNK